MNIILQAGVFAKLIIVILFFLSLFSWAIIFHKIRLLRRIKRENRRFLFYYNRRQSLKDIKDACDMFKRSPLSKIAMEGIYEWESYHLTNPQFTVLSEETRSHLGWRLELVLQGVKDKMEMEIREEESQYERYISFLATTTAVSPFLGLLGTVWGITQSFMNIRGLPVINLPIIAPGISDALITTVAGLLVAVPALVAYNYILSLIRTVVLNLETFSQELINDFRRQFLTQ